MKCTASTRNCQARELKIHSPQVFIRQIKLSGWRDPWKDNTKEACYTQVQICFPFTASERSRENVCSMSLALISVIPTAPSEGRKAILSILGVDFCCLHAPAVPADHLAEANWLTSFSKVHTSPRGSSRHCKDIGTGGVFLFSLPFLFLVLRL